MIIQIVYREVLRRMELEVFNGFYQILNQMDSEGASKGKGFLKHL